MKNLITALIAVFMCCTAAMATENSTKPEIVGKEEKSHKNQVLNSTFNEKPSCTVTASASYTGSGIGCNGEQWTATSVKSASCTGADCQAAYVCASISAYGQALADVNSLQVPCF